MRKLLLRLLLFSVAVLMPITANAKEPKMNRAIKRMLVFPYQQVKRYESDTLVYRDSIIDVTFDLLSEPYRRTSTFGIKLKNKTEERIYIEWENARIDHRKVVFGHDYVSKQNDIKGDECVIRGEESEYVFLFFRDGSSIENDDFMYKASWGTKDVSLILPIRKNNKELDYRFTIRFSLYDESEVDSLNSLREKMYTLSKQIKKGFTREQVEEILGKPICEGSLPKGGGGSIALRFMPLTTKRGDLCLEYSFLKIYLRDGKVHHIEKVVRFC